MRRGRDLRNFLQQLQIFRMLAEFVVAHQRAERLAAENAVLFFVHLLEHRALVEFRRTLQIAQQVLLRRIQNPDLQLRSGLRLVQQIFQSAPGRLQFLKLRVVQHFIQLQRNQMIDLRHASGDHLVGIAPRRHRPFQNLGDEFLDQSLAPLARVGSEQPSLFYDLVEKARLCGLLSPAAAATFWVSGIGLPLTDFGFQFVQLLGLADGVRARLVQLVVGLQRALQIVEAACAGPAVLSAASPVAPPAPVRNLPGS